MHEIGQCLVEFTLPELEPSQGVDVCAMVWAGVLSQLYHLLSFIQMPVVVGPHVGQIIVSISGIGRIDRNRFSKEVSCFIVKTGLLRGRAVVEIKSRVCNFGAFGFRLMQSFFECGDRFLKMFCFALSDGERSEERRVGKEWRCVWWR